MDRVDSAISKETIDFEEDTESNTEEGNTKDRAYPAILKEAIDFKNIPPNLNLSKFYIKEGKVKFYIEEGNVMDIADPTILEEHGIEIRQQLEDYLDLVKRCTTSKGEDRTYMIHFAKELRRIEKCFRALGHENLMFGSIMFMVSEPILGRISGKAWVLKKLLIL
ncbi:hypothetical protein HAX54_024986 [Datura stramonium]|uniref:Uncharacterized protein n=1 Tax=Datura stramonium TaxID=4076 RepID=A0ABS8V1M0_DATST|nr:hypothetical protein [Datura stramonium]